MRENLIFVWLKGRNGWVYVKNPRKNFHLNVNIITMRVVIASQVLSIVRDLVICIIKIETFF